MATWTVMFCLAGADDLEPFMAQALQAMEAAGPPPGAEVLVQLTRAPRALVETVLPGRTPTGIDGDWHGTRRYRLRPRPAGGSDRIFHSELLADLGTASSADPALLSDFVAFCTDRFPAERTLLVISGHGMGFVGLGLDLMAPRPSLMSIRGVAASLRKLKRRPDLLLLDSCQMNCLENACQLALPRPAAHWLIAPASHAPRAGLDYPALLSALSSSAGAPFRQVAATVAASLQARANQQVLALEMDPEKWRRVALIARNADGARYLPMFRAAVAACAHPTEGRVNLLVHWPDSPHFPPRYHHLYRRLTFARMSGWRRLLPQPAPGEPGESRSGAMPAPTPLLEAWLKPLRPDLTPDQIQEFLHARGWADQ